MNRIIVTYAANFCVVRFFAGTDDDGDLVRVGEVLLAADYVLTQSFRNEVDANSNAYYLLFTRVGGAALAPPAIDNVTWVDAATADPAPEVDINSVIVTYAAQFAVARFYGGADSDVALCLACNALVASLYVLDAGWRNTVLDNDLRAFLAFTLAESGVPLAPPVITNVQWVG